MRYELDVNARRSSNGTALFGGSPFRLLRLSPAGSRLLDAWLAGESPSGDAAEHLQRRLVDAGLIHPLIEPDRHGCQTPVTVAVVVPHFDDPEGLRELLDSIGDADVVVVDDASPAGELAEAIAVRSGAMLVGHAANRGPAVARNTGWHSVDADVVLFVDSDVVPAPRCVETLLAHFHDPSVAAVAPRVRARPGASLLDRFEGAASPLDLGPHAAIVRPGSAVPYVPSTMLAVRRSALDAVGGFDEVMRVGEDVDFVWRLVTAGHTVRYEPRALAHHRNRSTWWALAQQRHAYGTAAAELDARHPGDVAPVELPPAMLAGWGSAALGGVGIGALIAAVEAVRLRRKIADRVDDSRREALRLSLMSHRHTAFWLAKAVTRAWLPLVAVAAIFSRRARRLLLAAAVGPALTTWWRDRPAIDPASYVAASALDDVAYSSGLWRGLAGRFRPGVLLPRLGRSSPAQG